MSIETFELDLKDPCGINPARVTLAQTLSPDPSRTCPDDYLSAAERAEKSRLIGVQRERIRKQLQRVLFDQPDFVIFPELSIPWDMQGELQHFAVEHHVYIIGGLMYGPAYENACAIFTPGKTDNPKPHVQLKLNRAPGENPNVKTGNRVIIFKNSGFGTFAALICYDLTSLQLGGEIRKQAVNTLFVPTSNFAVNLFDDICSAHCYTTYAYVCLCNSAGPGLGGSASYGPLRVAEGSSLIQERVIGKLIGTQETTLPISLDIPGLCESIKRFRNNQEVSPGFITPPADFRESGALVSPYTPFGPAKENFVGRRLQINEFRVHMESNDHVVIIGPSGTGKSSLIRRLQAEAAIRWRVGYVEVYDSERTFDFFRRLSFEIISRVEVSRTKSSVQSALDDIQITGDMVVTHGFEKSSQVFLEAFHRLSQAISAQNVGKTVIFIDQAERLAWLEDNPDQQRYAIRILIRIMRELATLGTPVLFALGIREHDYDPLIALANDHLPARVISVKRFDEDDALSAIEKPLPPEITIGRVVSKQIVELSKGIPFIIQLLADAVFHQLGQRRVIDAQVWAALNIKEQRDIFPLLMNALTPNEQRFVEGLGMRREYTVAAEDLIADLGIRPDEFRHTADLLRGKTVIESLENNRLRFVHDGIKSFVQKEWLAAKMNDIERLRAESETALQLSQLSPEDSVLISYSLPPLAICCFKSLLMNDIENLIRILEQIAHFKHYSSSCLYSRVLTAIFESSNPTTIGSLTAAILPHLERNGAHLAAATILAVRLVNDGKKDKETVEKVIALLDKAVSESQDYPLAIDLYLLAIYWSALNDASLATPSIIDKLVDNLLGNTVIRKQPYSLYLNRYRWLYDHRIVGKAVNLIKTLGVTSYQEFFGIVVGSVLRSARHEIGSYASIEALNGYREIIRLTERIDDKQVLAKISREDVDRTLEYARQDVRSGDYSGAADSYAAAIQLAERIDDEKFFVEIGREATNIALKLAQQKEEGGDYYEALDYYKRAAKFAEGINDKEGFMEIWDRAIDRATMHAQEREHSGDYERAYFFETAELADKIGDEKQRYKWLYSKAIEMRITSAQQSEQSGNYQEACFYYQIAAKLAKKINDEKRFVELCGNTINTARICAQQEHERGKSLSASYYYVQIANLSNAIENKSQSEEFFNKAIQTFLAASQVYEGMTSFLFDRDTIEIGTELRRHKLDNREDVTDLDKLVSVTENCRMFIEGLHL